MTTYITTPIYYVNAQPHLGHAYTTLVADTYSRFKRLYGDKVRFQTGTDEHGDKIVQAAEKKNVAPKEYVDEISALFRNTWPLLAIEPDNFIRTTDANHIQVVQRILQAVYDKGDIYFDEYCGSYCWGCERYLTEKELVDGKCPDHQTSPEEIAEKNYFFRMSNYQSQLIDHINKNPDFITPERYKNEVLSFLSEPLEDLCISRPKSKLTWGIELPFDENFVTYVWFDALINYLTGIGYPDGEDFSSYWSVAEHVIAKDILRPHAIYWSTMLLSMGIPLYKKLHVHGYWNVDDTKMSKSLGNVVRPKELIEKFGADSIRYYTLREMSFGLDSSFNNESIIGRLNSDLANDLGNLFSRAVSMVKKYRDGIVPEPVEHTEEDNKLQESAKDMVSKYSEMMADFRFHLGLAAVWEFVSKANKYIVASEPWSLAKDDEKSARLDTVLYNIVESLRLITMVLKPVMPNSFDKMASSLGYLPDAEQVCSLQKYGMWGGITPNAQLKDIGQLFPRLDMEKPKKEEAKKKSGKKQKGDKNVISADGLIGFDSFEKVDLRVAKILTAEPIPKSKNLLKLSVQAEEERTIVAGIAKFYSSEDLVGKQVIIVANLKPAKLMGVVSQGMILAAKSQKDGDEMLTLPMVGDAVMPGSKVS